MSRVHQSIMITRFSRNQTSHWFFYVHCKNHSLQEFRGAENWKKYNEYFVNISHSMRPHCYNEKKWNDFFLSLLIPLSFSIGAFKHFYYSLYKLSFSLYKVALFFFPSVKMVEFWVVMLIMIHSFNYRYIFFAAYLIRLKYWLNLFLKIPLKGTIINHIL